MPVLSIRIVLDCFYLLIFYFEKFSTHVCRLPYAANVNLNLSNTLGNRYVSASRISRPWPTIDRSPHPGDSAYTIERFHSRGHHLWKFIGTKESAYMRKEFNSHRISLGRQHGRRFIVLGHQYGRRDVM